MMLSMYNDLNSNFGEMYIDHYAISTFIYLMYFQVYF